MIGLQILPLSRIMPPMKRCLFLFPLLLLTACQPENTETPADPQAMYDKAQALLKPNVENGQSDFAGAMQWLLKAAEGASQGSGQTGRRRFDPARQAHRQKQG